jgi:hypothetical protein
VAARYFRRAATARAGAALPALDAHDRFIVAYEGLFASVVGVLAHYGLRPGDGEGHRAIALQAVLAALKLPPPEIERVIRLHQLRNATIYRSPLPASEADAQDALDALTNLLQEVKSLPRAAPKRGAAGKKR